MFFSGKAMNIVQTNVGTILCMLFGLENITMNKSIAEYRLDNSYVNMGGGNGLQTVTEHNSTFLLFF